MKYAYLTVLGAALAAPAFAQTPVIPHPGAPSAVVRSGPAATMGPTAAPVATSTPAQLPVQPVQPAIPTTTAQPVNTLAPSTQYDAAGAPIGVNPGSNPATLQQHPVTSILPAGSGNYTFYKEANTYYNPRTRTYYYQQSGEWKSGVSAPVNAHLGKGRTVKLEGQADVNGANPPSN